MVEVVAFLCFPIFFAKVGKYIFKGVSRRKEVK
jgi:hypothetical protein